MSTDSNTASYRGRLLQALKRPAPLWIWIVSLFMIGLGPLMRLARPLSDLPSGSADVSLSEMIQRVKEDLMASERMRLEKNQAPLVKVQSVELEVSFVVKEKRNAKGEVKFELVAVSADGEYAREQTQKVKLTLVPDVSDTTVVSVPPSATPLKIEAERE